MRLLWLHTCHECPGPTPAFALSKHWPASPTLAVVFHGGHVSLSSDGSTTIVPLANVAGYQVDHVYEAATSPPAPPTPPPPVQFVKGGRR